MTNAAPQVDPQKLQQALSQLHDIQLPPEPGFWPLATGWWLLIAGIISVVVIAIVVRYWWRRTALKRAAMAEWQALANSDLEGQALLTALAQLLKRVAVSLDPNAAALTDQRWAEYLNQQGDTNFFTTRAGQQLLMARFGRVNKVDAELQLNAVQQWLKAVL